MLAIWRCAGSFRGESRVRTWVIAIARRQARDRLRRRQLRLVSDTELADRPSAGPRAGGRRSGGRHFVTSGFRPQESMQSLSCPSASNCVVSGVRSADLSANAIGSRSVVAVSTDAGASWTHGSLPSGFGSAPSPQVACPDAERCFMLGSTDPTTGAGGVATSADGGRTWTERPLPSSIPVPFLSQISCPTDSTCYVSGTEAISQRFPDGTVSGGSAMILGTSDAGLNWSRIRFPALAHLPVGMNYGAFEDVGDIQCPKVSACVALGVSDQGSRSTPVYTDSTP
jgi:hypothetical protein